jgi:predicted metal-dependent hydrolase
MQRTVYLNGRRVDYELTIKNVKNINLRIKPDGNVWVSANKRVPIPVIEDFMASRCGLILSALDRFAAQKAEAKSPASYNDGDTIKILGKEFCLRVNEGKKNAVCLFEGDGLVMLSVRDISDNDLRNRTFEKWQRELCRKTVTELCRRTYDSYPIFAQKGIEFPTLHFKAMRTRWGSCNSSGCSLNFNCALVHTPIECIEYVVMHEFVHFLHPNHSDRFYETLSEFMPDWKERKRMLNTR